MSVSNGQIANATTFNNAFGSKQNANTWDLDQTFSDATQSNSTATGAIKVVGGVGIAKNLYVGGLLDLVGTFAVADGTDSTSSTTGSVKLAGGLGVVKNINAGGNITATGTVLGSNLSGSNSGDVAVGSFSNTPSAQGISIAGQNLTLHAASSTIPGAISIGAQSFGGNKTFNDNLSVLGSFTFSGKTLANTTPVDGQVVRFNSTGDVWSKDPSNGFDPNTSTESVAGSGTITPLSLNRKSQLLRVQGSGGAQVASTTPLGDLAAGGYLTGTVFMIMGQSDTNTLRINNNDAANGALLNGDAILLRGCMLQLVYDSDLGRLVEISRNFE